MIQAWEESKYPVQPAVVEGGYFVMMDVTKCRDMIPEKYFAPGNYEEDKESLVIKREFEGEVPLDYAFARWMCVEIGLAMMPGSCFEDEEATDGNFNLVRIAICKG